MIENYYRPHTLEEALHLLKQPAVVPLGGGTGLTQPGDENFSVVDLQELGLNKITKIGNNLEIGAGVTLQQLLESEYCPQSLAQAIRIDAGLNIRNAATVAGALVSCDGRSAFATAMLAQDAKLAILAENSESVINLGDYLPVRPKGLITAITIPLNVSTVFETVARTPMDKPIVCAAMTRWASGRIRLSLGGTQNAPVLALDGTTADDVEAAARNAFHEADDAWATSAYRASTAATLAKRCLSALTA